MPNPYTGTDNDPISAAQHQFLGKDWEKYFVMLNQATGGRLPRMGAQGPGAPVSLAGPGRTNGVFANGEQIGDAESARSNAINAYLSDLTDQNKLKHQADLDMAAHNRAVDNSERERQAGDRAMAIANDPRTSAFGRPIASQGPMAVGPSGRPVSGTGSYTTLGPNPNEPQPPVNRQAVAAQMAPGVIAPPAPAAPVTFGAPTKMTVAGPDGKPKDIFTRMGSDGVVYDMARKPIADPTALTPPPATSTANANSEDAMIATAAKNILANPRDLTSLRNISSLRGDQRLKLFNAIKETNPDFNVGNVDRQIKFLDSYEDPKGRAASNRSSMNNILMHSADLSDANQQYRRSDIRVVNTPIAALQRQGGTAWQQFATPLAVLKDEIGLYFAGGYAPSAEQGKTWNNILNDTATPAQVEQFAKDIAHVGLRRADTHNQQFKTMMGYDDPNLITPEAKAAAERIGMGDAVKKYGSGGTIGAKPPAAAVAAGPSAGGTVEMIAPDGAPLDVPPGDVAKMIAAGAKRKR